MSNTTTPDEPRERFTFELTPALRKALDARADREERSAGGLVRHLLNQTLAPEGEPLTPQQP